MLITNYIADSFQEYEGEHSLVLFSEGCNLNCSTCHNRRYGHNEVIGEAIDLINQHITPLHTAVVFLGGEPTIWGQSLIKAIKHVKSLGLKVKLFTNGLEYKTIIDASSYIDAISIDLKALSGATAREVTNVNVDRYAERIIKLTRDLRYKIPVELRTTNLSVLPNEELERIKKIIPDDVKHIIQEEI